MLKSYHDNDGLSFDFFGTCSVSQGVGALRVVGFSRGYAGNLQYSRV